MLANKQCVTLGKHLSSSTLPKTGLIVVLKAIMINGSMIWAGLALAYCSFACNHKQRISGWSAHQFS